MSEFYFSYAKITFVSFFAIKTVLVISSFVSTMKFNLHCFDNCLKGWTKSEVRITERRKERTKIDAARYHI